MTGPAALLLALALGAGGRLETGVRLVAQARHTSPVNPTDEDSFDLVAAPRIALDLESRRLSARASYTPTFTAVDVGPDVHAATMHVGEVGVGVAPDPAVRLDLVASGAVGRTDLVALQSTAGGGASSTPLTGTITTTRRVNLERSSVGGSLRLAPDRRGELVLSGGFLQEGGTDAYSRQTNPFIRGLESSADLRWNATRRDVLSLRAAGYTGRAASRHADSAWASAIAGWRRRLSPAVELWMGAGAVALWSRTPGSGEARRASDRHLEPAAELGLARSSDDPARLGGQVEGQAGGQAGSQVGGQLAARLGASVDRFTGVTSPSFDLSADLRWPVSRWLAVTAHGEGEITWPSTGSTKLGTLRAGPAFRLGSWTTLELAAFGTRQRSTNRDVPPVDSYGASLAVLFRPPTPVRF
jgi:hypothetical protein